jgi:hypothetical protein
MFVRLVQTVQPQEQGTLFVLTVRVRVTYVLHLGTDYFTRFGTDALQMAAAEQDSNHDLELSIAPDACRVGWLLTAHAVQEQ